MSELGKNVAAEVNGDILTLTVDLSKEGSESSSKKSIILGSTQGNKKVEYNDGEVTVGLNVYKPVKKGEL